MAYSGKFTPKNPQKYVGDYTKITYRSSWEARVMTWLDKEPNVISWASEELAIPYISPVDGKRHRYFPDFIVKVKNKDGKVSTMMIEVKPQKQSGEPAKRSRLPKQYITEVMTYGINQAKWKAAQEYCLDKGWQFKVLTEKELGL